MDWAFASFDEGAFTGRVSVNDEPNAGEMTTRQVLALERIAEELARANRLKRLELVHQWSDRTVDEAWNE